MAACLQTGPSRSWLISQCAMGAGTFCRSLDWSWQSYSEAHRWRWNRSDNAQRQLGKVRPQMRKSAYFHKFWGTGWPSLQELEPYFLGPPGDQWFHKSGNDSAGFDAEGVDGTEHLQRGKGRVDVKLAMWGHPDLGVLLIYSKWGGGHKETFSSGDLDGCGSGCAARMTRHYLRPLHPWEAGRPRSSSRRRRIV
jgi:hypothetical protein